MKKIFCSLMLICFLAAFSTASAQNQQKEPTTEEIATQEADRLAELLELEDWQVFYVDSTLQHDLAAMKIELEALKKSGAANPDLYLNIQDRYMQQIDDTYQKFFNEKQWAAYLKSGAAKAKKARDKRAEKSSNKK